MHPRLRKIAPFLLLTALPLLAFGRLVLAPGSLVVDGERPSVDEERRWEIRSGQPIPVGNDLTRLFLPNFLRHADAVRQLGRIPGWDPFGFGGRPRIGNPQAGLFYPPIWAAWAVGTASTLGWLTVAHLVAAGFGSYRLARLQGLSRGAATVAGGVYQCSPYLLAQAFEGHLPHVWAMCWAPWAFAAMIRFRRGERAGAIALPPFLALTLLTGHPQEGYFLLMTLGLWCLIDALRSGRTARWRLLAFGLLLTVTLGLLAVEWLPDLHVRPWALRSSRLSLRQAGQYHTGFWNLLQLLTPRALGGPADYFGPVNYWETVVSIGAVPLLLAIAAVARAERRDLVRGWGLLAALALLFAGGSILGLFALAYAAVPGIDHFRVPARALFLAGLAGAQLAGLGIDTVRAGRLAWRLPARRWIVAGACALIACGVTARLASASRIGRALTQIAADPLLWAALLVVVAAIVRHRGRPRLLAGALGTVALLEVGLSGTLLIRVAPIERFVTPGRYTGELADRGPYRVRAKDAFYTDLQAVRDGVQKTNIYDSFQLQHAADLYEPLYLLFEPRRPFDPELPMDAAVDLYRGAIRQAVLDRMGVALLITDRPEFRTDLPRAESAPPAVLYRNPDALPRAYVVPRVAPLATEDSIPNRFWGLDPRTAVLMAVDPLADLGDGPRQAFRPARYESADPDVVTVDVETDAPGLLVVADAWMPGWTATLDGRPAAIRRGDGAHRVVALRSPGRHHVTMRYDPPGYRLGLTITAATGLLWLAATVGRRSSRSAASPSAQTQP